MKRLFFLGITLFVTFHAFAQNYNYGLSQVSAINRQDLKKVYIEAYNGIYRLVAQPTNANDTKRCLYIDSNGGIRKFVCSFDRKDGEYCIIAYYSRWGMLSNLVFRSKTPGGYTVEGNSQTLYFDRNRDKADTIAYTYKLKYDDGKQWTDTKEVGRSYIYPEQFGDLELMAYSNIVSLMTQYGLYQIEVPADSKTVHFGTPERGDVAFTNQNDILVKRAPTVNSTTVATLNAGQRVWILGAARAETQAKQGTHYWYRVKLAENDVNPKEMYVYGAYLEAVERDIPVSSGLIFRDNPPLRLPAPSR